MIIKNEQKLEKYNRLDHLHKGKNTTLTVLNCLEGIYSFYNLGKLLEGKLPSF